MKSWPAPSRPQLPGTGPQVCLHDTASGTLRPTTPGATARMYVCGITPYDAAHLGHAATYVAFDLLHRAWLDAGHDVDYVQNVTDVDDPLLERAIDTGVDWRDLAESQTTIFRDDMSALAALPPTSFVAVTEVMAEITALLRRLADAGASYEVPVTDGTASEPGATDTYFDVTVDPTFGCVSGLDAEEMATLSAERGGDPDRPGKRNPLDPLLWRAARVGEPAWSGDGVPAGRPGWHVECVAIALRDLGAGFDVQGGGSDLAFPHHEMGASHSHAVGARPFAQLYAHAGMVGLDGEKMSKSKGNLVFVHRLLEQGTPAPVVRLVLLAHHYRSDWAFDDGVLTEAAARFTRWRDAVSRETAPDATAVLAQVRTALADDLDAPRALAAVDAWCAEQERAGGDDPGAPGLVARLADSLLGVRL